MRIASRHIAAALTAAVAAAWVVPAVAAEPQPSTKPKAAVAEKPAPVAKLFGRIEIRPNNPFRTEEGALDHELGRYAALDEPAKPEPATAVASGSAAQPKR